MNWNVEWMRKTLNYRVSLILIATRHLPFEGDLVVAGHRSFTFLSPLLQWRRSLLFQVF